MSLKSEIDENGIDGGHMDVLVLGLCRTGTQSLNVALNQLGYPNVYHMYWVFKNNDLVFWNEALKAKFERSDTSMYDKAKFDQVLHKFQGTTDIPAAFFAEELIKAYPDAKIILSTRDEDKWFRSMKDTVHHIDQQRRSGEDNNKHGTNPATELPRLYFKHVFGEDFDATGRQAFRDHNAMVKKAAGEYNLLVYDLKDGWEPLCKFLDKPVPSSPMPHIDAWSEYKVTKQLKDTPVARMKNA